MKYDTILWDMDGTLLDTLDDLADAFNAALMANGHRVATMPQVRAAVGSGVDNAIACLLPGGLDDPDHAAVKESFLAHYALHSSDKTRPYPGLMDVLQTLRKAGASMAVVSNKMDPAVKELSVRYFGDLFPVSIGESANVHRKPAPDTVFAALKELGKAPAACVYIGDSEIDIATAKNAGLPCISVTWGFRDRDQLLRDGATLLADNPEQVLDLIGL